MFTAAVNKPPPVSILPPRMPIIFDVSAVFQSEYRRRRCSSYFRRSVSVVSVPVFIYIIIVMTRRRWPSGRVSNYYYSYYYCGGAPYVTINYTPLYCFALYTYFIQPSRAPTHHPPSSLSQHALPFFSCSPLTPYHCFSLFPTRYRFINVHL